MSDKFQNKYRIPSARLQTWDYGWNAAYFVTICTHGRECYFGDIVNGVMQYSPLGAIANVLWYEIENHTINIELDVFQVMPNHVHGIVIINNHNIDRIDGDRNNNDKNADDGGNGNNDNIGNVDGIGDDDGTGGRTDVACNVSTTATNEQMSDISPKQGSLSTIIRSYKSAVTKHANRLGLTNGWQSRFHDHIIRNNGEYQRIRNYIINNPRNWDNDKFNKDKNHD